MSLNSRRHAILKFVQSLSKLLDQAFNIPGTKIKIGLDPLLGLIPGIGDFIGFLLSTLIVVAAILIPASPWTIVRMILNIILESVIGLIPVLGDAFDFIWKANVRNRLLLEAYLDEPSHGKKDKTFVVGTLALTSLAALAVSIGLGYGLYLVSIKLYGLIISLF